MPDSFGARRPAAERPLAIMTEDGDSVATDSVGMPVRRGDVTVQELDGEALIYDPVTADTHRLNETAYLIWRWCDGKSGPAELGGRLAEVYEVEPDEALAHARRMVEELIARGLVFSDPLVEE